MRRVLFIAVFLLSLTWGTMSMLLLLRGEPRALQNASGFMIPVSGEHVPPVTGTNAVKFRMPYAFSIATVRASLSVAQASGSIITVDINEGGSSILSTKLTIDNTETTSTTAATPVVVSDGYLADDAEISIDIDQVGTSTAARGLKIYIGGERAP